MRLDEPPPLASNIKGENVSAWMRGDYIVMCFVVYF